MSEKNGKAKIKPAVRAEANLTRETNKPIKVCKNLELHFIFHYLILGDTASREPDRESASNTGVAGASITGSVASSSYVAMKAIGGRHNRLEVSTN